jgi:hypothetical protein
MSYHHHPEPPGLPTPICSWCDQPMPDRTYWVLCRVHVQGQVYKVITIVCEECSECDLANAHELGEGLLPGY